MRVLSSAIAASFVLALSDAKSTSSRVTDLAAPLESDVDVTNVPDCGRNCLGNCLQHAAFCSRSDFKCLCNNAVFVDAMACCLATTCKSGERQAAIQLYSDNCAIAHAPAVNFVLCMPSLLTTGASSIRTAGRASSNSRATSNTSDAAVRTISGNHATRPTAFTKTNLGIAAYTGDALLTGSCTVPMFAEVTDGDQVRQFPQVGCALNRDGCCPYDPNESLGLTKCPQGYFTTSSACCPSGFSVFSTMVGADTPCFSPASATYVPATTASGAQLKVTNDAVFSRKFPLVSPPKAHLSSGERAGIAVGVIAAATTLVFLGWILRRIRKRQMGEERAEAMQYRGSGFRAAEALIDTRGSMMEALAGTAPAPKEHGLDPAIYRNRVREGRRAPTSSVRSISPL